MSPTPHHHGEDNRPKFYCLDFFPYPSGAGLTVGHCRNYVPTDVISRYYRMQGHQVLHPMGWDAFGLPAENEAIKHGTHPAESTARYAANYKRQMQLIGCSYDWDHEINSSDPQYYRWTQWFFLLLYRRGLAYRAQGPVNWCPGCQTVLAAEEVEGGHCWRCHTPVTQRSLSQWWFRITDYAQELAAGLEEIDWPQPIKAMQHHWITNLRDWLISRQRYWGTPIPIVHCPSCGVVPVPEDQLPVRLPHLPPGAYEPRGDGRSPLANIPDFVNTTCPRCSGQAQRETDTMSGFACSSWYFLRFTSPHDRDFAFDPVEARRWLPVDLYVGGAEHATAHLLYARFWTRVLADEGLIDFREPFPVLRSQGVVHASDGKRMSKSRPESVVTPDEVVARHGVDALRAHVLFVAPFDADITWDEKAIAGVVRWLERMERLLVIPPDQDSSQGAATSRKEQDLRRQLHQTINKVSEDIEAFKFNTAIAALMSMTNALADAQRSVGPSTWRECTDAMVKLLAPFVPNLAQSLWQQMGRNGSVFDQAWPTWQQALAAEAQVVLVVQVDGRTRDRVQVPAGIDEAETRRLAMNSTAVQRYLGDKPPARFVVIPGRLINIVTS